MPIHTPPSLIHTPTPLKHSATDGAPLSPPQVRGFAEGPAALTNRHGDVYSGPVSASLPSGRGEWRSGIDSSTYVGDFARGVREGSGVLTLADGGVMEGEWKGGELDGLAEVSLADGFRCAASTDGFRGRLPRAAFTAWEARRPTHPFHSSIPQLASLSQRALPSATDGPPALHRPLALSAALGTASAGTRGASGRGSATARASLTTPRARRMTARGCATCATATARGWRAWACSRASR